MTSREEGSYNTDCRFTGQLFDTSTALYYYGARYYDPDLGRFLQRDPIAYDAGDMNLYRYCGNNGVNMVDPMGFDLVKFNASFGPVNYNEPFGEPGMIFIERNYDPYKGAASFGIVSFNPETTEFGIGISIMEGGVDVGVFVNLADWYQLREMQKLEGTYYGNIKQDLVWYIEREEGISRKAQKKQNNDGK